MRAVLRATFAARRSARPTAAENSFVSFFTLVDFTVLPPAVEASLQNYHTRSRYQRKDDNVLQSCSNYERTDATRRQREHRVPLASRELLCGEARAEVTKDRGKLSQSGNRQPSSDSTDSNRPNRSKCFQKQSLRGLWRADQAL